MRAETKDCLQVTQGAQAGAFRAFVALASLPAFYFSFQLCCGIKKDLKKFSWSLWFLVHNHTTLNAFSLVCGFLLGANASVS